MKIENNIPIPEINYTCSKPGDGSPYPFGAMEVGDHVFIPNTKKRIDGKKTPALNALHKCAHRNNMKFVSAEMNEGLGVWRIA
jgi:hypothetical protein